MGFFSRVRNFLARAFEPVTRRREAPPPAPPKSTPRRPPKPRPTPKPRKRAKRTTRRGGILQVGSPHPKSPPVYPGAIRRLMASAVRRWPDERVFAVAVFARWQHHEGEEGMKYPSPEELDEMIGEAYGSPVRGITEGRYYYGWRANNYALGTLRTHPLFPVEDLLTTVPGRRPVRAVSVRPLRIS